MTRCTSLDTVLRLKQRLNHVVGIPHPIPLSFSSLPPPPPQKRWKLKSGGVGAVVRSLPPNPRVKSPASPRGWISAWPSFPLKFTQLSISSEVGKMSTSVHGPHYSDCQMRLYLLWVRLDRPTDHCNVPLSISTWKTRCNVNATLYFMKPQHDSQPSESATDEPWDESVQDDCAQILKAG